MAAATRLGYRGNWAAAALVTRRSRLVGLLVDADGDENLVGLLQGTQQGLSQRGYACLVAIAPHARQYAAALESMLARGAEALVFVGGAPRRDEVDALEAQRVPWVAIAEGGESDSHRIDLGRAAGLELAARYLLSLGHERLAILADVADCGRGLVDRAIEGKATIARVAVSAAEPNGLKLAVGELLDAGSITAVLCRSDADALGTLRECILRGVRVPAEVSIVGFGDQGYARQTVPALTTVRCSPAAVGLRAAEAVLATVEGCTVGPYQPPVKLVIRETTGPAP